MLVCLVVFLCGCVYEVGREGSEGGWEGVFKACPCFTAVTLFDCLCAVCIVCQRVPVQSLFPLPFLPFFHQHAGVSVSAVQRHQPSSLRLTNSAPSCVRRTCCCVLPSPISLSLNKQVCLSVLYSDNQANGLLAMRLFVDLSKHLVRNQVASYEQHFNEALNFMHKVGVICACYFCGILMYEDE